MRRRLRLALKMRQVQKIEGHRVDFCGDKVLSASTSRNEFGQATKIDKAMDVWEPIIVGETWNPASVC